MEDSQLPRAVREANELAEKLQAQLENPAKATPNTEIVPEEKQQEQSPEQNPVEAEKPKAEIPPEKDGDVSYWRNKYRVIEGKYKAEVPRLNQENNTLKQTIQDINSKFASQSEAAPQTLDMNDVLSRFSQKDREEYGDDLIELVTRVAGQIAPQTQALPPVVEEIQQHMAEVKDDKDTENRALHLQAVDRGVPNWREINASPEWLSWLGSKDQFTSIVRQHALDDANRSFNAAQVIHIFNEFKRTQPSVNVPGDQIQPDSVNSTNPPAESQVITRQFISDFYADVRRGDYDGRKAEEQATEALIHKATKANEVR